ncbi:MAG: hypothetical protein IPO68_08825 [Chitinophagaceae bacterium]|nr:hypothetical protein [Chitinophagaceae bacterium]
MFKEIFFGCLLLLASLQLRAQTCTFPGQTPVSAVFVCSSETFTITTPTYCGQTNIPTPCADGAVYQNLNPNFFALVVILPVHLDLRLAQMMLQPIIIGNCLM